MSRLMDIVRSYGKRPQGSLSPPAHYELNEINEKRVPTPEGIPAGAVLLAPRYDGVGRPLAAVPACWCCKTTWRLKRLQEWRGKPYAFLEPACGCLDAPQALGCCGLCTDHCRCRKK